jgi:hypothetical protein
MEGQVSVFISLRNKVAQLYPRALRSLSVVSLQLEELRWRYSIPPPHGIHERQAKVKSVGQALLVSGAHLGPATNFSFSLRFSLDSCGFVIL